MEPCRPSSTKSKRRSADENNEAHDCNNNVRSADGASLPLLGEDNGSSNASSDELLTEPNSELCHSGSSFEAAIKAADRVTSSFSETTAPMNNNYCSTSTQKTGSSKSKSSSSKWRYPFRSGRRPIIDAMDILGKETVRGLKGAKLPLTPNGAKNDKFTKSQKEGTNNPSSTTTPSPPITSIALLENGLFLTASKSHKNIKLWKFKEQIVSVPPTQGKDDDFAAQHHDIDNNAEDKHNEIEFICEFRGHGSGVTTIVKLDKRGHFLTASFDKTVKLWEIDCTKDDNDGIRNGPNLLATFTNLDKRWIKVSNTTLHLLFPFRLFGMGRD